MNTIAEVCRSTASTPPPLLPPSLSLIKWACLRVSTRHVSGDRHLYLPGRRGTTVVRVIFTRCRERSNYGPPGTIARAQVSSFTCRSELLPPPPRVSSLQFGFERDTCCSRAAEPRVKLRAFLRRRQLGRRRRSEESRRACVSITFARGPLRFCLKKKSSNKQQLDRSSSSSSSVGTAVCGAGGAQETRAQSGASLVPFPRTFARKVRGSHARQRSK